MQTRHLMTSLIVLMAIFLAACSEQQPGTGMEANGVKTFTFKLTTDGQAQTRAAAPTVTGHKLQYILQVLDADGNPISTAAQTTETGSFSVALPLGVAYTCLFWAQYIPDAGGPNEFFDTTDLKAVTLKKHLTSDDKCQAFCAMEPIAASDVALTKTVVMKRAVAQVNIKSGTQMVGYSKLKATYDNVPNTFNVQDYTVTTGGSGVASTAAFEVTDFTATPVSGIYTYQSAYTLASADGTGSMLDITLETYTSAVPTAVFTTKLISNAPTKKNVRTNVLLDFDSTSTIHTYTFDFTDFDTPSVNFSTWKGTFPAANPGAAFSGGAGTQADPYIIGTADDFAQFAANSAGGTNYDGVFFKLDTSIDLGNHPWTPIKYFIGTFDGQHNKITGLKVEVNASDVGLFAKALFISNLHVSGSVKSLNASGRAGGICGWSGATAVFANCSFAGSVEGAGQTGGIVGEMNNGAITACKNSGAVTSPGPVGGILGRATGSGATISGCYNEGAVTGTRALAGGIASNGSQTISGCYNIGTVTGGGAAVAAISVVTMTSCYVKEKYAQADATEEHVFSDLAWPVSTAGTVWYADPSNDGTANKYWKSLGSWNGGTAPEYPKLWWEK